MKLNDKGKFKEYKIGDIVTYLGNMGYTKLIGSKFKIIGGTYLNTKTGLYMRRGLVHTIVSLDIPNLIFHVYGESIIVNNITYPDE